MEFLDGMNSLDLENVVKSGLDDLDEVLKSEIEAKQMFVEEKMPADFGFNFEIGDRVFTREFNGERICVEVMARNHRSFGFPYVDDDDSSDGARPSFNLVVKITKEHGNTVTFNASVCDGEITVRSMSIRSTKGLWCSSYDSKDQYIVEKGSNLQSAAREYLKSRGIKKSNTDFMHAYSAMISTQPRTDTDADVLKSLQDFLKD